MGDLIRCVCGHALGIWNADGEPEMRHRGRRVVGFRLVECECCGAEWRGDMQEDQGRSPVLASAGLAPPRHT